MAELHFRLTASLPNLVEPVCLPSIKAVADCKKTVCTRRNLGALDLAHLAVLVLFDAINVSSCPSCDKQEISTSVVMEVDLFNGQRRLYHHEYSLWRKAVSEQMFDRFSGGYNHSWLHSTPTYTSGHWSSARSPFTMKSYFMRLLLFQSYGLLLGRRRQWSSNTSCRILDSTWSRSKPHGT